MKEPKLTYTLLFITLFLNISTLSANGLQPQQINDISFVTEVSVSPDGRFAAYVLYVNRSIADGAGANFRELHLLDLNNKTATPLITGSVMVASIGWTPDGKMITYRQSTPETKGMQVFAISPDGKTKRQLTSLDRTVRSYQFIDDKNLAITATAAASELKSNLLAQGFDMEVFEEELRHIDLWRYNIENQRMDQLTQNVTVFDFAVSPDGLMIAAAIADENTVDASYMFKRIHILDAANGQVMEKIDNPGKLENMAWSPDSKKLAFIAASMLEDAVAGSLFVFETNTGQSYNDLKNLVQGQELSAIDMDWQDNNTLLFASEESVDITVRGINLKDYSQKIVLKGGVVCFGGFQHLNGVLYFNGHTPAHPQEVMRYNIKNETAERLTDHNPWLAEVELALQEKISYSARDGWTIEGVLMYPLNYVKGKSYPLITYIHGGPEAAVQNGWLSGYSHWGQFAAAKDFFVFFPNYRASSGRGVDFTMAGYGDLVGKEYEDVLDGIDYLIDQGMVDPARVGIGGGSYGGFFAAWSATRYSERFAAAVVFVGIANQVSKRKTTDIPLEDYHVHWGFWTHENHEEVWDSSPVKYAHQSQTPTLILHGKDDPRIPVSQGMELYRALKLHSQAPVRFVVYPGEGHGNAKNTNRYDYLLRTLEWFEYYLVEQPGSSGMPDKYLKY